MHHIKSFMLQMSKNLNQSTMSSNNAKITSKHWNTPFEHYAKHNSANENSKNCHDIITFQLQRK